MEERRIYIVLEVINSRRWAESCCVCCKKKNKGSLQYDNANVTGERIVKFNS